MEQSKKNYELNSEAVADLVREETPEYSQEELNKYRSQRKIKLPELAKVLLIKAWFAGAVCYFILWGLGFYLGGIIDILFVLGVALGMVTDLLTNNVIRFIEKTPEANAPLLMIRGKGVGRFFLNVVYGLVIVICVYLLYNVINLTINTITGNPDAVPLGVEPVLFGIFCMGFDLLFVRLRNFLGRILRETREKLRPQSRK